MNNMNLHTLLIISMIGLFACKNNNTDSNTDIIIPDFHVTDDEVYITQEYVDSLTQNRQQRLIDLRRNLGFDCVNIVGNGFVNLKIKVLPDGSYKDVEILEKEGVDVEPIRECVNKYFEENTLHLGELKDLPSSGKTTNKHPHVYTLLLY